MSAEDHLGQQFTVYHVTAPLNRESISQHGLIPGANPFGGHEGQEPRQWGDMNWVFTDRGVAERMAHEGIWGGGQKGRNDIWAVNAHPEEVEEDPHPGWEETHYAQHSRGVIKGRVPPERLRLHQAVK